MRLYMASERSIIVEHRGQELEFQIHRTFNKTALIESYQPGTGDTFDVINEFLELLSNDRADKLFAQYDRFLNRREVYMGRSVQNSLERDEDYRRVVRDLYKCVDYQSVHDWMGPNVKIVYPEKVEPTLGEGMDADRTYTQPDYFKLAALALTLRIAVPILCQYIYDHGDSIGNDRKEMMALKLLDLTDIIYTEPYERFVRFIEATNATVDNTKNTFKTIQGVGSEEQQEISKTRKIVRRVAFLNPLIADTIITAVFNEIVNQPTDTQRSQNRIKDKKRTGSRSDEEETSVIEQYKIKEELPKGDIRSISYYLEGMHFLTKAESFTKAEMKQLKALIDLLIKDGHEMDQHNLMMAMFFVTGVPAESIEVVDREFQIIACVSVYALMMKWGKHDLALLALGKLQDNSDDDGPIPSSNRATIPPELERQLDDLYPYRRKARSTVNVCKEAIAKLFGEVSGCLIRPIYPVEDHELLKDKITSDGYYVAPRTVSIDLAEVIVRIHSQPETN